ncbi:MAG: hypothetical protein AB7F43_12450 [Bacteriovoracia bacterium]
MEDTKTYKSLLQNEFEKILCLVSEYELQTNPELLIKVSEIRDELLMFGIPEDSDEDHAEKLVEEV